MLDLRLLGDLRGTVDGRPVELPADARARELLARLALAPGPHPRSVLAGRLRPDVPEESARKTLRSALYELRRALGEAGEAGVAAIVADARRVGLDPAAVSVDLWEFRRLRAAGELEAAVALATGPLLEGLEADWAAADRDAHAADLAQTLQELAVRAEKAGEVSVALRWVRRRLEAEPLAEEAHRELIRLLALSGDRPAALAAASALADRLRVELRMAPSAATRALVEEIRSGRIAGARDDASGPGTPPALPAPLAGARDPVGRRPALSRLHDEWAAVLDGARRFVLVSGEPGIGKSTLAGALARRVHAQGAVVLLGRSDEHALVPFQPWIEALECLLGSLAPADADVWLTAHGGALARLLPARSATQAPSGDPRERYLAFEVVRELLEDVARRRPVLLVLDDVHWADADSLALVRHLAHAAPATRQLIVLCARPAELGTGAARTLAELRREGPSTRVDLAGLDDEAVAELVEQRTGAPDLSTARRYRARSGGNPLFLGELLREAEESGEERAAPPEGVAEVIDRRLARLDATTLRVLGVAAVVGLEFDVDTVARAGEHDPVAVLDALDAAAAADLVSATARRGRHAFSHALLVETILAGLPASRRAQLSLRVAELLVERHVDGSGGAGEVARRLRDAGALADGELVARWELAAAREATAALAHTDAAAHYEAALTELVPGPHRARGEVLLDLGRAEDRAGRRDRARAAFAEAAVVARALPDAGLLAEAALGHGGMALVLAAADPSTVGLLEESLVATGDADRPTSARLLARLSVELYYDDPDRARELSALAVDRARDAGDPSGLAAALNARRVALWSPHHAVERLATADEMLAVAQQAGDRQATLQARTWRVVDLLELGRVEQASAEVDAYAELAEAVALPHFGWYVPLWRGTLALLAGRWDEAAGLADRALDLASRADDPNGALFVGIQRSHALHTRRRIGEIDRARIIAGAAASPAPAEWEVNLALVDAEGGNPDSARPLVTRLARDGVAALALNVNWHSVCVLADAAVVLEDRDAAAATYEVLEPHASLFPLIARGAGSLGPAELHVGRLAGLLGRQDEALTRLRRAVAESDRVGAGPFVALAQLRLGEALRAGGEEDAARDALQQAVSRAELQGMPELATVAARLLD